MTTAHQAEWMTPQRYFAAIERCPVAIVPWGAFEWHGPHLPLGLDGTKAHAIGLRIAEALGGGVVLPPHYAGHRTLKNARGFGACLECRPDTVIGLMHDTLTALDDDGCRVIVIVPGHYGQTHRAVLTCGIETWRKARGEGAPAVWQASDYAIASAEPEFAHWDNNDHAGMWETSLMMALHPESVELDALEDRPEGAGREDQGILGRDPKRHATRELGDRAVEVIVAKAAAKIRELLAQDSGSAN
jgi:creatinine amidohydrolase